MNKKILVAVPAYNCEPQIARVIDQFLSAEYQFQELLIIDNCSTDNTLTVARRKIKGLLDSRITLIKNNENYGLGGTHKVAFNYCKLKSYDGVLILHGDDQGKLSDFESIINQGIDNYDCYLGARFMPNSKLSGYSFIRVLGNKIFNWLYTLCTSKPIYDMGSGLNYYDSKLFFDDSYLMMPDDLTFNNAYLLFLISANKKIHFFPISWREDDQISNANLYRQSKKLLIYLFHYLCSRALRKPFQLDNNTKLSDYSYRSISQ